MQVKKLLQALAVAGVIAIHSPAQASGIPTVDVAAIAQDLMSYTADIQHYADVINSWQQQYQQMTQQLNTLKSQYEAITGARGMGQLLNALDLYNALPPEWQTVYQNVKAAGDTLQGVKAMTDGQKIYYGTINTNIDQIKAGYQAATDRLVRLQALMSQIDSAQDQKAAQDLANRIGVEQTILQNENARIGLMVQMQQIQMKVAEEQRLDDFNKKHMQTIE